MLGVEPFDLLAGLAGDGQALADRVLERDDPLPVAGHAREAGDDRRRAGRLERVADDLDRAGVDPLVLGVDQQVALQAVGQVEDDLAAGVLERLARERVAVEGRPEGNRNRLPVPSFGLKS